MTNKGVRTLHKAENPQKKILFLGYDETQTEIIKVLIQHNCSVDHMDEKIDGSGDYDLVVSYGYRHILKKDIIERIGCPIFNLHISYLPYNRGAHPNFWSFYDDTPSGVTIHLIDDGVDTGPIVFQKYVKFSSNEDTFSKTYAVLVQEVESLFIENVDNILRDNWTATEQEGAGTHHCVKDLPSNFSGWDSVIKEELKRLYNEDVRDEANKV